MDILEKVLQEETDRVETLEGGMEGTRGAGEWI